MSDERASSRRLLLSERAASAVVPAGRPMKAGMNNRARWLTVAIFAVAMAWVEAAVVFYLRRMVDRIDPYQPNPLPLIKPLGAVELAREAATLVMLLTVGMLAGRTWRSRLGYTTVAFGVWDIFYYVFLKVMCGWPHSLFDWDILFLLPLPWWGPVLAPMSIALLLILWGTLVSTWESHRLENCSDWKLWLLNLLGIVLAGAGVDGRAGGAGSLATPRPEISGQFRAPAQ